MIITLTALPGVETKTIGRMLTMHIGLRFVSNEEIEKKLEKENLSEGDYLEKLKQLMQEEAKKGDFIIDHPLSPWILNEANVKIFLQSLKKVRARQMAEKKRIPFGEAMEKIEEEEKMHSQKALQALGANVFDLGIYDLIINLDKTDLDGSVSVIKKFVEKMS